MKQLDLTKPVQTHDGRPVRILCTDAAGEYPVVGIEKDGEKDTVRRWTKDGRFATYSRGPHSHDLINVPVKRRLTGWLNVYPDREAYFSELREDADREADATRIACIPIDIKYTEGDGLDGAQ